MRAFAMMPATGHRPNSPPPKKKRNAEPRQNSKYRQSVIDPLVNPGSPPHRHQARPKADPTRTHHCMVTLAQSSPGRRSTCPLQNTTTVMLALLWQNVCAPLFFMDLFPAVWTPFRRRPKDEIDDGMAYGGHGWLRRRAVDFFFSDPRVRDDGAARSRRQS